MKSLNNGIASLLVLVGDTEIELDLIPLQKRKGF